MNRIFISYTKSIGGFPGCSDGKESTCKAGDPGLTPGLVRTSREGKGYPPPYSPWRDPWTEEPGGLQSMGSEKSDTTELRTFSKVYTHILYIYLFYIYLKK